MTKPNRSTFQHRLNEMLNSIRHNILSGVYKPGDFLPAEMELAEQFQLSKNSVRIILEKLVQEELIVKHPRVGTQVAERKRQKVVRFGVYPSLYEEANMGELIERFMEMHPHIQIEPFKLPYFQAENVKQLLQSGIVDVITLNHIDYVHFRETNQLSVFEPFSPERETYPFLNALFATEENMLHVRPFIFSPVVLCYNKEHFGERRLFEPDSSWDWHDLREVLGKLTAPNRFGLYFHLSSFTRWPIFLLQNRARFRRDEKGLLSPEDPETLALLRFIRDLIHEDGLYPLVISFGEHDAEKLFKQQKVSAILTTYYRLNQLKDAEFSFDISPLPKYRSHDTLLLTTGIAVGASSANKEEARCFADYLLSEESQTFIRRHTFSLPSNKLVTESVQTELANKPARLELHRELIPHYATHDRLQLSVDELQVFGECLGEYFSGLVDEEGLIRLFNKQLSLKG
ncbi:extracellular solute-binding protein [Paenibacillus mesophilus]|uniref:extracellular solute-binding protein n=1 Tax=Paenibacillus mesophilus TaxID=2582849 RepID=UPI00110E8D83|nr:extracellular solute-binding protein [Paenibacillus mesophilus]TMV48728.1 extracellular solute-binding protein [Paenibacillus mesophilus]